MTIKITKFEQNEKLTRSFTLFHFSFLLLFARTNLAFLIAVKMKNFAIIYVTAISTVFPIYRILKSVSIGSISNILNEWIKSI